MKQGNSIPSLEIGRTGIDYSYGYIFHEFLKSLRGVTGIRTYREMTDNDPVIGACLFAIKQLIRETRWNVEPFDKSNESEKNAEFLRSCLFSGEKIDLLLEHTWQDFLGNVLTMLEYGWSWFEQVFIVRSDGRIVWRKLAPRHQSSFEKWEMGEHGEVLGMWQRPAPDYNLFYLPKEKCLHFCTESNSGNPEGRSILRNAYRPWHFKKCIEELEGIGIERDLVGLPVINLPEGVQLNSQDNEEKQLILEVKKLIASVRNDEQAGLLLPRGWEFSLISSPGGKQFDTVSVINRYNKEITVSVLAQFVMLGMERTGSYALAEAQMDMFNTCLESFADGIASQFNRQAIPSLFRYNGIVNQPLPYLVHTPIRHHDLKDLSLYIFRLTQSNALDVDEDLKQYLKRSARLEEYSEVRK